MVHNLEFFFQTLFHTLSGSVFPHALRHGKTWGMLILRELALSPAMQS